MKLFIVGDISPTPATEPYFKSGDLGVLFGDTLGLLEKSDFCLGNLECALTDSDVSIKKFGPALKSGKNTAATLKKAGFTHLMMSNNHIFDFGVRGIEDTRAALRSARLGSTGFGNDLSDSRKDLVLTKGDEQAAVINVCEHEYSYALEDRMGARPFDEFETVAAIRKEKEKGRTVVVVYHGGKEYSRYPSPRLVRAFRGMAEAGASLVVGQHSHIISCYERYRGCHLLYGQGNFLFVRNPHKDGWDECVAIRFDTETRKIALTPVIMNEHGVEIAKGERKKEILEGLAKRSEGLRDGSYRLGWREYCENNIDNYVNGIGRAVREGATDGDRQALAHFFDCEAHSDVIREMFTSWNYTNEK